LCFARFIRSRNIGVCVAVEIIDSNVIIVMVLAVFGAFMGTMYLRTVPKSSKNIRQQNTDLENLNAYNKKQISSMRAKLNSEHALPKVSGNLDDIDGVIAALLPKITNKFPELKGLIGDQDISAIIKLAKDHPEIVKKFLPKFLSTGKKTDDPLSASDLSV